MKRTKSVRNAVLDAAVDLVQASGAGQLTLEAVAARAGVSKGGLLHHFKSKDALLTAMIARLAEGFEADRQAATDRLTAHAGDTVSHEVEIVETYLDRAFAGLGTRNNSAMPLFAGAAQQPALLQPIRDYFARRTREIIKHSGSATEVLALMMLADGLWLFDALGIAPFTGKARDNVHRLAKQWARQMIEQNGSAPSAPVRKKAKPASAK